MAGTADLFVILRQSCVGSLNFSYLVSLNLQENFEILIF